jgi:hypothetical protein
MTFDIPLLLRNLRLFWKFRDYQPKKITAKTVLKWLAQFDSADRASALKLIASVNYLNEAQVKRMLIKQNDTLLRHLSESGIPPRNVIYVSIDAAGSSSAVILNLLRDSCHLERRGCRLLDSRDMLGISQASGEIENGAIVYVDDFSASGSQFARSRDYVAENLIGTFAEFFLVACICEEAMYKLAERRVEARAGCIHSKAERPLHDQGGSLEQAERERLRALCTEIDRRGGLGYAALATNVVLYRNSPNTTPVVLRGNKGQDRFVGVFPRTDDLEVPALR